LRRQNKKNEQPLCQQREFDSAGRLRAKIARKVTGQRTIGMTQLSLLSGTPTTMSRGVPNGSQPTAFGALLDLIINDASISSRVTAAPPAFN
jgi:hypothetical protein